MRLPIARGALRGWWWSPLSGGKVLRVLTGSYEPRQTDLFERWVTEGATVFDLGAHTGYYTLLAARFVGTRGRVVAFEPNPRNLRVLRSHVRMNRLANVEVVAGAAADAEGVGSFVRGSGSGTGHLGGSGGIEVPTTTVDAVARRTGLVPTVLKIDVEGSELAALCGAESTLRSAAPTIFLSVHGRQMHRGCSEFLHRLGYAVQPIDSPSLEAASELLCTSERRAGA